MPAVAAVFYPLPATMLAGESVEYMRDCLRHQHVLGNAVVAQDVLALVAAARRDHSPRNDHAVLRSSADALQAQMLSRVDEAWFYLDTGLTESMWAGIRASAALGKRVVLTFLRDMTSAGLSDVRAVAMEVEGAVFRKGAYYALITYMDDPQVGDTWSRRSNARFTAAVRWRAHTPDLSGDRMADIIAFTAPLEGVPTLFARPYAEFVQRYRFLEANKAGRGGKDGQSR